MPGVFVLIWSTGFIVARLGMPHAPPMSFLAWRFGLSALALLLWARAARAPWPVGAGQWRHLAITGLLMHAGYLGGVWSAVKLGMGAGMAALLVGLQPLLTAAWFGWWRPGAANLDVRSAKWQWAGLWLGFGGLCLVVRHKLIEGELEFHSFSLALVALLCITGGTLYQKRHVEPCDVRTAGCVQLLAAFCLTLPFALMEAEPMQWRGALFGAMAWSVGILTLGGSSLLYLLIQRGAATQVASLMYLVPPCTALLAALLFGEVLSMEMLLGMGLTAWGVLLVGRTIR
jgi:drug/metabolite transporter (DMT)-like permease